MTLDLMFACGGRGGYTMIVFQFIERHFEYNATFPEVLLEL